VRESIVDQVKRKLPGLAGKSPSGDIHFLKGVVIYSSPRVQAVRTDSKIYELIHLIGDTYLYTCSNCVISVWEQELQMQKRVSPFAKKACPMCGGPVEPVQKGDKVRLHYRYAKDASWASWWAERWEW
jgi:hypothetical protein